MYLERTSTYSVASTRTSAMMPPRSPTKLPIAHHLQAPSQPSGFGSKAMYVLGALSCLLLFLSTYDSRKISPSSPKIDQGRWVGADRSRHSLLETQIESKDIEIESLKAQLSKLTEGSSFADTAMQDHEENLKKLQQRYDNERAARAKAQYALQERSEAYERCKQVHKALLNEADDCHRDLKLMMGD